MDRLKIWKHRDWIRHHIIAHVAGLKSELPGLKLEVSDLKLKVPDLKLEVPGLKTEVPGLKTEVPDLRPGGTRLNLTTDKSEVAGINLFTGALSKRNLIGIGSKSRESGKQSGGLRWLRSRRLDLTSLAKVDGVWSGDGEGGREYTIAGRVLRACHASIACGSEQD